MPTTVEMQELAAAELPEAPDQGATSPEGDDSMSQSQAQTAISDGESDTTAVEDEGGSCTLGLLRQDLMALMQPVLTGRFLDNERRRPTLESRMQAHGFFPSDALPTPRFTVHLKLHRDDGSDDPDTIHSGIDCSSVPGNQRIQTGSALAMKTVSDMWPIGTLQLSAGEPEMAAVFEELITTTYEQAPALVSEPGDSATHQDSAERVRDFTLLTAEQQAFVSSVCRDAQPDGQTLVQTVNARRDIEGGIQALEWTEKQLSLARGERRLRITNVGVNR